MMEKVLPLHPYGHDVLVDMDGVLTRFDDAVEANVREQHPEIEIIRPRSNFYIHEDYLPEYHAAIKGIWRARGFYRELEMTEGAIEGWKTIIESGFPPRICSSIIPQNPECKDEKIAWLEEHMVPALGAYDIIDNAIFGRDKTSYPGLVLIDDKPVIPKARSATWKHLIFDAPYNQPSDTVWEYHPRLYGWKDPELISKIWRAFAAKEED